MSESAGVVEKLKQTNQLLALVAIKGADEGEGVLILSRAGFAHAEIGQLMGLSGNAVKLRLLRQRRAKKSKRSNS